ncbi:hypothetical protein [Aliiroseovarius sp.]|uniref:hypothetical protein n=1 Tax=Aliiroseovarius sp. TaxID=1872442 RepID=UPI00260979EE|nr:hypothetical protein [Aliiroseovarius sp.]
MSFPDAPCATVAMGRGYLNPVIPHQGWKRPDPAPGEVPATYPLAELHDTQAVFISNAHAGNIVVEP